VDIAQSIDQNINQAEYKPIGKRTQMTAFELIGCRFKSVERQHNEKLCNEVALMVSSFASDAKKISPKGDINWEVHRQ
jgi:hypothetical protein